MSLDGYVTAAGVRPEEPMGDGGQQLHDGPSALTSGAVKSWPKV
jgi:hypothetical protein